MRQLRWLSATAAMVVQTTAMRLTPPAARLVFQAPSPGAARKHVIVGTKEALLSDGGKEMLPLGLPFSRWKYLVELADEGMGKDGSSSNWMFTASDGKPSTIVAGVLPSRCSRHNSPVQPHAVTALVKGSKSANVVVVLEDATHAGGTACAIGRAFPLFTAKTPSKAKRQAMADGVDDAPTMTVSFATKEGAMAESACYASYAAAAEGVRRAARLVDLPPDQLTTTAFVGEARAAADRLAALGRSVTCEVSAHSHASARITVAHTHSHPLASTHTHSRRLHIHI